MKPTIFSAIPFKMIVLLSVPLFAVAGLHAVAHQPCAAVVQIPPEWRAGCEDFIGKVQTDGTGIRPTGTHVKSDAQAVRTSGRAEFQVTFTLNQSESLNLTTRRGS